MAHYLVHCRHSTNRIFPFLKPDRERTFVPIFVRPLETTSGISALALSVPFKQIWANGLDGYTVSSRSALIGGKLGKPQWKRRACFRANGADCKTDDESNSGGHGAVFQFPSERILFLSPGEYRDNRQNEELRWTEYRGSSAISTKAWPSQRFPGCYSNSDRIYAEAVSGLRRTNSESHWDVHEVRYRRREKSLPKLLIILRLNRRRLQCYRKRDCGPLDRDRSSIVALREGRVARTPRPFCYCGGRDILHCQEFPDCAAFTPPHPGPPLLEGW